MEKKRLAVITGTRAEYGLLRPVILKLLKSNKIIPLVIATGAHLSPASSAAGFTRTSRMRFWFWATGTRSLRRRRLPP